MAESPTGSFAFPPRQFGSAEELIEFFETVAISDRILSNADHAYQQWRRDSVDAEVRDAYAVYGNDPEVLRQADRNLIISERLAREFVANSRAQAEAKRPVRFIEAHRLRNVLRAHQMWIYSATPPDEGAEAQILNHKLFEGDWTVRQIVEENATTQWADRAMTDSDLAAVDAMRRVVSTLDEHAGF